MALRYRLRTGGSCLELGGGSSSLGVPSRADSTRDAGSLRCGIELSSRVECCGSWVVIKVKGKTLFLDVSRMPASDMVSGPPSRALASSSGFGLVFPAV